MINISNEEAEEMKRRAIARAIELDIANITKYILDTDATTTDEWEKSRPLPGAGLIMLISYQGQRIYKISIHSASNPTDRVFWYEKDLVNEAYKVFRDGPWVHTLVGLKNSIEYELANKGTIKILGNYAPIEGQSAT